MNPLRPEHRESIDITSALRGLAKPRAFVVLVLAIGIVAFGLASTVRILTVSGDSMTDTFKHGDTLVVLNVRHLATNKLAQRLINRGTVVIFSSPRDNRELLVKRVVAIGGDYVKIEDGILFVNGRFEPVAPPSIRFCRSSWGWFAPDPDGFQVPHGQYFVLGDNRATLGDSRLFGGIHARLIQGIVISSW